MEFDWDDVKSTKNKKERGIGHDEAIAVFYSRPTMESQCTDNPEQYKITGFIDGRLYSVIYEDRGDYYWIVTLWKSTKDERREFESYAT